MSISSTRVIALLCSVSLGFLAARAEDAPAASDAKSAEAKTADAKAAEAPKRPSRPQAAAADRYEAMRAQRDSWIKDLGASDEQRDQLRAALKEQAEQSRAIRSDQSLDAAAKREKLKALQQGTTGKMKKILTPEQFGKYEKLQQERRDQLNTRIERRRPQAGDRRPTSDKPADQPTESKENDPTPADSNAAKSDK